MKKPSGFGKRGEQQGFWQGCWKDKNRPSQLKTSLLALTAGSNLEMYHGAARNSCADLTPEAGANNK
jgi:hypothetical protein